MAADCFPDLVMIIVLFVRETKTIKLHFKMPIEDKNFTKQSHLKFESVSEYCSHRDDACMSNNTNVCGVKMINEKMFYKDFENGCYLFLSNMCDHPEEEYFIATAGSCEQYLTKRRDEEPDDVPTTAPDNTNSTETDSGDNDTVTEPGALRQKTFSKLYEIDTSFDYHVCPHSCPNIYAPECITMNRGYGKYFKMFNFVNHCSADVYYCKFYKEFDPPPPIQGESDSEGQNVRTSPLTWSYCGAHGFVQFARFSETVSSIGHYGWLAGDYKFSHIMEPHQRIPGYG